MWKRCFGTIDTARDSDRAIIDTARGNDRAIIGSGRYNTIRGYNTTGRYSTTSVWSIGIGTYGAARAIRGARIYRC